MTKWQKLQLFISGAMLAAMLFHLEAGRLFGALVSLILGALNLREALKQQGK